MPFNAIRENKIVEFTVVIVFGVRMKKEWVHIYPLSAQQTKNNDQAGPEVIKLLSYSTQLSTKFILLTKVKMSKICWHFNIY